MFSDRESGVPDGHRRRGECQGIRHFSQRGGSGTFRAGRGIMSSSLFHLPLPVSIWGLPSVLRRVAIFPRSLSSLWGTIALSCHYLQIAVPGSSSFFPFLVCDSDFFPPSSSHYAFLASFLHSPLTLFRPHLSCYD